jgi:site-specific DNA-cytosine methylase
MVVIGPPCQPFSQMRDQRKLSPAEHKDYQVTFGQFPGYLERVRPHGGLLEQVPRIPTVQTHVVCMTQHQMCFDVVKSYKSLVSIFVVLIAIGLLIVRSHGNNTMQSQ